VLESCSNPKNVVILPVGIKKKEVLGFTFSVGEGKTGVGLDLFG